MKIGTRSLITLSAVYLLSTGIATAQVKLSGYFIARSECPAFQSIRKQTNPGDVTTVIDQAYDLFGKNKTTASHYLIRMQADPPRRWVAVGCGEHVIPVNVATPKPPTQPPTPPSQDSRYVLSVSWQPAFCETRPTKQECQSQTEDRFDASHFTLHGLWPQPRSNIFCDVTPQEVADDKNKRWSSLPELTLADDTRQELNKVMPGTQSFLQRHEWTKHGTCYHGESPDKYFQDSLDYMRDLNAADSAIRKLFAENVGLRITAAQVRDAFEDRFGDGTGAKIKIACKKDGNRLLITEITIGLQGELDEIPMSDALFNAPRANNIGCSGGIVDPVGLQ